MSVEIHGDLLALDGHLCHHIRSLAAALQTRFPGHPIKLIARIGEEFDLLNGHRVRCELSTSMPERPQILVREARKSAEDAITAAFSEIKKKFRQMSLRLNTRAASGIFSRASATDPIPGLNTAPLAPHQAA